MRLTTQNHQEGPHRDHSDDRYDLFPAGLFHDLDLIDEPATAACRSICRRRPRDNSPPARVPPSRSLRTVKSSSISRKFPAKASARVLQQRLAANPELLVLINADERVEHGRVVDVMDDARQAGVVKMAIAVKPKDSRQ